MEPYAVNHGPLLTVANCVETPKAPPRRKRPQRRPLDKEMQPLRRSLSFTDAHFIAQAVYEGDTKPIEELYPDFPRYVCLFDLGIRYFGRLSLAKKHYFLTNKELFEG